MLGYMLYIREINPSKERVSSCLYWDKIGSGAHSASSSVATKDPFPRGKAAEARSWPLTPILYQGYKRIELYPHSPIRLQGVNRNNCALLCYFSFHLGIDFYYWALKQSPCWHHRLKWSVIPAHPYISEVLIYPLGQAVLTPTLKPLTCFVFYVNVGCRDGLLLFFFFQ